MKIKINEIQNIFSVLQNNKQRIKLTTAQQRIEKLNHLKKVITKRTADIGWAIHSDLGRMPDNQNEVLAVLSNIETVIKNLDDWMKPIHVDKSPGSPEAKQIFIKYEPRGVVLLFGTWDFPLEMVFSPLIQAVAAGNTILVKPNSLTPASGKVVAEIITEVFLPSEVAVINGISEVETSDGIIPLNDALLDLPVDHIFLTGSPNVGKIVIKAAAKHMASFTLELGGKAPAIVHETADLDLAAQFLVKGKMYNHGQSCLAVDYVWVPEHLLEVLIEKYINTLKGSFYIDNIYQSSRESHFINRKNFDRVKGYLDQAIEKGAKIVFGGNNDAEKLIIEPTVLINVPMDTDIIREEIFGPLLPFLPYKNEEEIYDHSNSLGKPLAFYIYAQNDDFIDRVLSHTTSGGVTVNGWATHFMEENLPFGGVNTSGYGRYHGIHGFHELSNARSVYHLQDDK